MMIKIQATRSFLDGAAIPSKRTGGAPMFENVFEVSNLWFLQSFLVTLSRYSWGVR
jgi:hypothetical protein